MRIKDIANRDDLVLLNASQDVEAFREAASEHFTEECDCDSFFVNAKDGTYSEIYGFRGALPVLSKELHSHLDSGQTYGPHSAGNPQCPALYGGSCRIKGHNEETLEDRVNKRNEQ